MFFVSCEFASGLSSALKSEAAEIWTWYCAAPETDVQWNAGTGVPTSVVSGVGAASTA